MLSRALKRYYEPLRLPAWPTAISSPYTRRLMSLKHHHNGSPALDCLSSAPCRPCYPGRLHEPLPFSTSVTSAFPICPLGRHLHLSLTRLLLGSLSLRPAALPIGNLRPLIAQTPLPCATGVYGQFPGRDFNPLDKQLLLRTD